MERPIRSIKPEIMSPAGYWPQLNAALEAGADAVYFGLHHFSARAKVGFSLQELPDVMRTLHQRGAKGYVTFNTLIYDEELDEATRQIADIALAGADAIIVQDVGIARLAKRIVPELAVHGSTQMSLTSAEGIRLAQTFGVSRVVMARELSLDEVRDIRRQTSCELEMFAHGALCVSYSGQCFSSEAWGGRSANRGQCAQACRLPYELIVDGLRKPPGDARYLLSPGDLYTLRHIPDIIPLGISALKIEGRYKDADYVALTTAAYRKAVDEAWAGRPLSISPREELQLEQVYSRGLGPYFLTGTNHQAVVKGRSPRHRGVLVGHVARIAGEGVLVNLSPAAALVPIKPGDGLVFDAADWRSPQEPEEGGRVYTARQLRRGQMELRFANGALNYARIRPGDLVWRSHDPELDKVVRPYLEAAAPVHKQPVNVRLVAHVGEALTSEWRLTQQPDVRVSVALDTPLAEAQHQSLDAAAAREQLGRLGNTPYELAALDLELGGRPFVPSSLLNQLRRQAVTQLAALQAAPHHVQVHDPRGVLNVALEHVTLARKRAPIMPEGPWLHLLVRTPEQLEAALALRPASITLDYLDLYGLRPAVERVQIAGILVRVASPRILKPNEQRIVNFLLKLNCEIVVRSSGLLDALTQQAHSALVGDFSLNAANAVTAQTFLDLGLARVTPSHDLNAVQVAHLAQAIGPQRLEVIAYHHLPVFHTEHCVFCRFLSSGTSYKDCGHPCEQHRVSLRDLNGRAHPVMADVGCRNTVFGAEAQEASRHLDAWLRAGITHYRLEFVHETAQQVTQISRLWLQALRRDMPAHELTRRLQQAAPQGTTEGSLFVPLAQVAVGR
jgi:putative protease